MDTLLRVPTRRGDVLILSATMPSLQYSLATVNVDGQQYFGAGYNVLSLVDFPSAVKQAKRLVWPGCDIYVLNIDTGEWALLSRQKEAKAMVGDRLSLG